MQLKSQSVKLNIRTRAQISLGRILIKLKAGKKV